MTRNFLPVRRPWRRLFCALALLLLMAAAGYPAPPAPPAKTTISDVLYRADGTPAAGTLVISWPAFTTADQAPVAAGSLSLPIGAGGAVSLDLVPNEGAEPAGTYYKVVLKLSGGETSTEFWTVPAASPTTISAIRATVMPAGVAIQAVSRAYVDAAVAGKANDAAVLHNSGDESVAGVKQFSASPLVPTPASDQAAANKAYVDGATAGIGNLFVAKAGDTMAGPLTLSADPVAPGQAANRHYVDTQIAVVSGGLAGKADRNGDSITAKVGNGQRFASQFTGANAGEKIQAAIADLPATGGTVEADFEGAQTISSDVFSGVGKPLHLILGPGTYAFSADAAIPANVTLDFRQGAKLAPAAGVTVTVLGSVRAAPQQPIIDPANGSVLLKGNDLIYVNWYGARNDALIVQSCSMSSGSAVLSGCSPYTGSGFTAADVGKTVLFHDYGYSVYPGVASAKIQSVQSASQVTLDTNATRAASGIIAYYGSDTLAATNAALANGSKHYLYFRSLQLATAGGSPSAHADYVFSGAVTINTSPACSNGMWVDGNAPGGGYSGSGVTLVFPSTTGGFKVGPDCFQFKMSNLELFGLGGFYVNTLSTYTLFSTDIRDDGPHGIVLASGEPQLDNVYVRQFKGHGIYVDGASKVFPSPPAHASQPDFWKMYNVGVDANRGYGIYVDGADSNAGVAVMVNSRSNQLGGIYDYSQLGNTWVQPGSNYDNRNGQARGATKALASCSVTSNVLDCVTSVAHGFTMEQWVVTSGQGDASFDTTCRLSAIVSTTEFRCPFTHADGSTTGGTAQTAGSGDVYALWNAITTPVPVVTGSLVGRGASSSSTWIHPYCEVLSEAPPNFNQASLVLGGNCVGNTGTGASINYAGIIASNGGMTLYSQQGFTFRQPNGGNLNLNLVSGQNSDSLAPGYQQNNIRNINFYKWDSSTIQYQIQAAAAGNTFYISNLVSGGGLYDSGSGNWQLRSAGSNPVSLNKGTGTGGVCFGDGAGNCVATVNSAGKGSFVGLASGLETVAFSATPTFDCSKGNTHKITLTADVTSSTLSNCSAGQSVQMIICQDGSGSHAFTWPATMKGGMTVGSTASKCSAQSFVYDGTSAYAVSSGVTNQ